MTDIFTAPGSTSQQMADCLPVGKAWGSKNIDDSNTRKLINSVSVAHNRAQQQIELLAGESDINNTVALLSDWETSVCLPDSCSAGFFGTLAQRRETVIERLRKTPTVTLAEMQAYIDKKAPENIVRLYPASGLQSRFASTRNINLWVSVDTAAFYPNTVAIGNLTRTATATPHYIAATVGNDATIPLGGSVYITTIQDAGGTFTAGDNGKTIRFINADGSTMGTGVVGSISGGILRFRFETGTIPRGVTTGGQWGFSTETVLDVGDYTMTAAAAYFADAGVVGDFIKTIDADGLELNVFEIMSWTSTTVVGVNLISGALTETVWAGGTWDYSTEAITPAAGYNITSSSSYFVVGNIGDTIKVIAVDSVEVAQLLITGVTDDTHAAVTLSSGNSTTGCIAGGLWGWSTQHMQQTSETLTNLFTSNPKFILIAEVVGKGKQFEYDFEMTFQNGIDASRISCLLNKVLPANVILLIQYISG